MTPATRRICVRWGLLGLLAVIGAGGIWWLRRDNLRLRDQVAQLRHDQRELERIRSDNGRARAAPIDAASSPAALRAEIERLRGEIAAHERRREERHARNQAAAAAETMNRNPETGAVKMENLQNVGALTPAASIQTLCWAAMHEDRNWLARLLGFDPAARAEVGAWLGSLPASARATLPDAAAVAALFWSEVVTGHESLRVQPPVFSDPQHATVGLAFETSPQAVALPMELGPDGWRLQIGGALLPELKRVLRGASASGPRGND